MSRTSADAGAGENRQYRGPASEAIDFREQLDHTSETRFRRSVNLNLNQIQIQAANVNGDDAIDAVDAFAIQRFVHHGAWV